MRSEFLDRTTIVLLSAVVKFNNLRAQPKDRFMTICLSFAEAEHSHKRPKR